MARCEFAGKCHSQTTGGTGYQCLPWSGNGICPRTRRPREALVTGAKLFSFISVLAQRAAHGLRKSRIENAVPERGGDAVAAVNTFGAVVVQVVFLDAAKKRNL